MIRKRFELDTVNPPGQIVNPIPRELTIGGIVDRIMKDEPKKLTFNEWWDSDIVTTGNPYKPNSAAFWAYEGWKAAQENK